MGISSVDLEKNKKFRIDKIDKMIEIYSEKAKDAKDERQKKEAEEELVKLKKEKSNVMNKNPNKKKDKPTIKGLPPNSVIVFGKVIENGKQVGYIENGKFMNGIRRN